MDVIPFGVQKAELKNTVAAQKQESVLSQLETEYEIAKQKIHDTVDLRVLNSYGKRIQRLNNPKPKI